MSLFVDDAHHSILSESYLEIETVVTMQEILQCYHSYGHTTIRSDRLF